MADQYTVGLGFNRPPEDVRRMAMVLRRVVIQPSDSQYVKVNRDDILYSADVMDEIADKMEE